MTLSATWWKQTRRANSLYTSHHPASTTFPPPVQPANGHTPCYSRADGFVTPFLDASNDRRSPTASSQVLRLPIILCVLVPPCFAEFDNHECPVQSRRRCQVSPGSTSSITRNREGPQWQRMEAKRRKRGGLLCNEVHSTCRIHARHEGPRSHHWWVSCASAGVVSAIG